MWWDMKTSLQVRAKGSIAGLYLEEKYNSPLEFSLQWMKEKGRRGGIMRGWEVSPAGPVGLACVERLSIRFQETHCLTGAEAPSLAFSPHFSHHHPLWQPHA